MAYATAAQAIELYGSAYITVACDRDNDGSLDTAEFDKQLESATREMNAYLLGRYSLPLANPPEHFQRLCTDIAVYHCVPTADRMTDEIKERYKSAIKFLELVAANKVKLETSTDATAANAATSAQVETKTNVSLISDDRQMRRDDLKGLL